MSYFTLCSKARPIVDASKRVFGAVIPPPRAEAMDEPDPTFIVAADECTALLESNQPKLFKHRDGTAKTPPKHCRGIFAVKAVGVSFGSGQEVCCTFVAHFCLSLKILQYPKQIYHSEAHLKILDSLLATICFIHLAQHASSAFFCWAPHLYSFYAEIGLELRRNPLTCTGTLLKVSLPAAPSISVLRLLLSSI